MHVNFLSSSGNLPVPAMAFFLLIIRQCLLNVLKLFAGIYSLVLLPSRLLYNLLIFAKPFQLYLQDFFYAVVGISYPIFNYHTLTAPVWLPANGEEFNSTFVFSNVSPWLCVFAEDDVASFNDYYTSYPTLYLSGNCISICGVNKVII